MGTSGQPPQDEFDEHYRQLQELRGFDSSRPTTEFFDCFSKAEAENSLFNSTRSNPIPVFLTDDRDGEVKIPVVISLARPIYEPRSIGPHEEYPDWYFEGWIMPSGFVPGIAIQRIRIVVVTMGAEFDKGDMFHWQYILDHEPSRGVVLSWSFA